MKNTYADQLHTTHQTLTHTLTQLHRYRTLTTQHRRGGYPSSSLPTGTHATSTSPPLPLPDPDDQHLDQELTTLNQLANQAWHAINHINRLITARTTPTKPLPEPAPRTCDNPHCNREVGDPHGPDTRRYHGSRRLCPTCYQHAHRHDGALWPQRKDGTLVNGWTIVQGRITRTTDVA